MNNSKNTLTDKLQIDHEIEEMNKHPIDYSDIPERKSNAKVRTAFSEFLDTLPADIAREMARHKLKEIQDAGYALEEKTVRQP
jgi:DNA polymerase IIIc chi subunit